MKQYHHVQARVHQVITIALNVATIATRLKMLMLHLMMIGNARARSAELCIASRQEPLPNTYFPFLSVTRDRF